MENQENKLKCKQSQFKTEMSFNEWAEKYNVGRGYVPPTKYFQGNPSSGYIPAETESSFSIFIKYLISLMGGK